MSIKEQWGHASEKAAELAVLQVLRDNPEFGITTARYYHHFQGDNAKYGKFRNAQIQRALYALVENGYVEQITDRSVRFRNGLGNSKPFRITPEGAQYLTDELTKISDPLAAPTGGWQGMEEQRRAALQTAIAKALIGLEEFVGKSPERIEFATKAILEQIGRSQYRA